MSCTDICPVKNSPNRRKNNEMVITVEIPWSTIPLIATAAATTRETTAAIITLPAVDGNCAMDSEF
ncbi:MAG: hypothetical protein IH933_03635 [Euryarchaeota archaeon]|nr:hypothetical protein [Euryarchaeota archaeon]